MRHLGGDEAVGVIENAQHGTDRGTASYCPTSDFLTTTERFLMRCIAILFTLGAMSQAAYAGAIANQFKLGYGGVAWTRRSFHWSECCPAVTTISRLHLANASIH